MGHTTTPSAAAASSRQGKLGQKLLRNPLPRLVAREHLVPKRGDFVVEGAAYVCDVLGAKESEG